MKLERVVRWGLAGLLAAVGCSVAIHLFLRADRVAHEAAVRAEREGAPIVWTETGVTVRWDRPDARAILVRGWSEPESGSGVWSLGHEAVLRLPAPPTDADLDIAFTLEAFIKPGLPAQRVVVRSSGRTIAEWRLTTGGVQTLHATAPKTARAGHTDLELHFDLPDADSPARHVAGSNDGRELAIKLKKIEVVAITPDVAT
jgi:hypothetical protein